MGTVTKQQKKIPSLRFPEFSDNWVEIKLGNIADVTSSKRVYSSDYVPVGIPFFRGKEITELKSGKSPSDVLFIKKSKYEEFKGTFGAPMNGDILITSVGTLGNVYRVNLEYDFYFKDGNLIWLKDLKIDSSFLTYVLTRSKENLLKNVIGSTQKALTIVGVKKTELVIPNANEEQQKIADFLGSVDAWIDNLRGQKTELETYKRGMVQKLFTQQVRFKDDNGKNFPRWQEKKLGDVFSAAKGTGISKQELVDGGVNECILYGELYTTYKEVIFDVKSRTNISTGIRSKIGDILIPSSTTTTAIDLANVTALNKDNVLLGGDIAVLRGKIEVNNVFYAYYLSNQKKIELAKYGQGVTIIHIYYSHFKDMVIDVPTITEQQKIADFLTAIDQTITAKAEEITKVEQWKKGLMQKMFV